MPDPQQCRPSQPAAIYQNPSAMYLYQSQAFMVANVWQAENGSCQYVQQSINSSSIQHVMITASSATLTPYVNGVAGVVQTLASNVAVWNSTYKMMLSPTL